LNSCPPKKPCGDPNFCSEGNNPFHAGSDECFREVVPLSKGMMAGGSQCCYDSAGNVMTSPPAAGTYDYVAPAVAKMPDGSCKNDKRRMALHTWLDVLTYVHVPAPKYR